MLGTSIINQYIISALHDFFAVIQSHDNVFAIITHDIAFAVTTIRNEQSTTATDHIGYFPQFRSIIPCEVLLYIEVTFWGFIH